MPGHPHTSKVSPTKTVFERGLQGVRRLKTPAGAVRQRFLSSLLLLSRIIIYYLFFFYCDDYYLFLLLLLL